MSFRRIVPFALAALLTGTGAGLLSVARAGSLTYEILADTTLADSGLSPGPGGVIQVTLGPASPPGPLSVSAMVFNAATDGALQNSLYEPTTGTASGGLGPLSPGVITANNTVYSELDQNFTVGSFFDVFVTLSGTEIGPGATGAFSGTAFNLNIYDSNFNEIGVTFLVNPNGYVDGTVLPVATGPITVIPQAGAVPEPTGFVLLGLGLGAIAAASRVRGPRPWSTDRGSRPSHPDSRRPY
jgi:hypothetical protein